MVAAALLLTGVHALCMVARALQANSDSLSAAEVLSTPVVYRYKQLGSVACDKAFALDDSVTYTPPDSLPSGDNDAILFPISAFSLKGVKCDDTPSAEITFNIPVAPGPIALHRASVGDDDLFDFWHYGKYEGSGITCAADDDGTLPTNLTMREMAVLSFLKDVEFVSPDPRDAIRTTVKGFWYLILVFEVAETGSQEVCVFNDEGNGAREAAKLGIGNSEEDNDGDQDGNQDVKASSESSELSAGAIVGIVLVVLVGVALFGALLSYFHFRHQAYYRRSSTSGSGSSGNALPP